MYGETQCMCVCVSVDVCMEKLSVCVCVFLLMCVCKRGEIDIYIEVVMYVGADTHTQPPIPGLGSRQ